MHNPMPCNTAMQYCHAKTYIPYQQMGTTERYIKVSDQRTLLYIIHVIMSHGGMRHDSARRGSKGWGCLIHENVWFLYSMCYTVRAEKGRRV